MPAHSEFFIIGNLLRFSDDSERDHGVTVTDCEVVKVKNVRKGQNFVFRINLPAGTRLGHLASTRESPPRLVLAAESDIDRVRWVNALGAAGARTVDYFASPEPDERASRAPSFAGITSPFLEIFDPSLRDSGATRESRVSSRAGSASPEQVAAGRRAAALGHTDRMSPPPGHPSDARRPSGQLFSAELGGPAEIAPRLPAESSMGFVGSTTRGRPLPSRLSEEDVEEEDVVVVEEEEEESAAAEVADPRPAPRRSGTVEFLKRRASGDKAAEAEKTSAPRTSPSSRALGHSPVPPRPSAEMAARQLAASTASLDKMLESQGEWEPHAAGPPSPAAPAGSAPAAASAPAGSDPQRLAEEEGKEVDPALYVSAGLARPTLSTKTVEDVDELVAANPKRSPHVQRGHWSWGSVKKASPADKGRADPPPSGRLPSSRLEPPLPAASARHDGEAPAPFRAASEPSPRSVTKGQTSARPGKGEGSRRRSNTQPPSEDVSKELPSEATNPGGGCSMRDLSSSPLTNPYAP